MSFRAGPCDRSRATRRWRRSWSTAASYSPRRRRTSALGSVLASSIGGREAVPEVTRLDLRRRGAVVLLCSDGLTRHVSDEEIGRQLGAIESSEQVCRALLDLALEPGGSDNITVVVGRARPEERGT